MKRTKLSDRQLPDYSRGEEIMNMVTHIVGGAVGVVALTLCVIFAALHGNPWGVVTSAIYGSAMVTMFTISSVYHGLKPTLGKKVMQVLDHCTIYFLIAGTYTVILLSAIRPENPVLAWVLFGFEWGMVALATTLTAIDLKKYRVFSMICYIGMGWAIIFFARQAMQALTFPASCFCCWAVLPTRSAPFCTDWASAGSGCTPYFTFSSFWGRCSSSSACCFMQSDEKIRVTPLLGRKKPP